MPAKRFAAGTSVAVSKTRDELDQLLAAHGAAQRAVYQDDAQGRARVQFMLGARMIRLELKTKPENLPDPNRAFSKYEPRGWSGWSVARRKEWVASATDQYAREAWRRLLLVTRGKLELIADKASTVEREFLPDVLLHDGRTVLEALAPQLAEMYETGNMPPLLGSGT